MSVVLEQIFQVGFLAAIIRIATPLAFATLGEMFSERAGVLNLGIEGIMLLSAMTGFTATSLSGSLWLGVLVAVLTGMLIGALHALFTVTLGLSQHVCGIGVTLFASGLAYFLYRLIFGQQSVPPNIKGFETLPIPVLSEIPVLGPAVFNQFTLVYMAMLAVPLAAFVLYRTPWGLSVRMVGENPRAADLGRRQRHCHALSGSHPWRRADGPRRRLPVDGAVQRLHLRRRVGPRLGGDRACRFRPLGPVAFGGWRRCCSPLSMPCSCACRRAGSATSPTRRS